MPDKNNDDYYFRMEERLARFNSLLKERNSLDVLCQNQAITINNLHKYITKLKRDNGIM